MSTKTTSVLIPLRPAVTVIQNGHPLTYWSTHKLNHNLINMIGIHGSISIKLTLLILMLSSSRAQECKGFRKPIKLCHVSIHWIGLAGNSKMSTHVPRLQSFISIFHHFPFAKLAISCIRVNTTVLISSN